MKTYFNRFLDIFAPRVELPGNHYNTWRSGKLLKTSPDTMQVRADLIEACGHMAERHSGRADVLAKIALGLIILSVVILVWGAIA